MPDEFNIDEVGKLLRMLLDALPERPGVVDGVSTQRAKRLRGEIETLLSRLRLLAEGLDPIRRPEFIFDLSDPKHVGEIIANTLVQQPRVAMGNLPKFYGSGVYAIYYNGAFPAYRPIKGKETPIYVGKADPPTPDAKTVVDQGTRLWGRLKDHAKSIRVAQEAPQGNLKLDDFNYRFLVVQSGWQKSAEDRLIHRFHPIWNEAICYGFGKHGDSPDTRKNTRSPWDTLHSGRAWATREGNKPNPLSPDQIISRIAAHYGKYPPQTQH